MNISDYRLLKSHFGKIKPVRFAQAPRTKPEEPQHPPEYPAPIEIPNPTEIPSPVPGDAPVELPGPEENPTPEIEPPKEQLSDNALSQSVMNASSRTDTGFVTVHVQQIRSLRTTLIRFRQLN